MSRTFKQPGEVIDVTAATAIASGDVLVIGTRIAVALNAIPSGSAGSAAVTGVHTLTKLSTDVVAQGAALYWDAANKRLTTTAGSNTLAGYAFNAAAAGTTAVDIKINA